MHVGSSKDRKRSVDSDKQHGTAPAKPLLRVEAVADLLDVTIQQVHNMRHKGQMPAPVKVPGLGLRWYADTLHAWIQKLGKEAEKPGRTATA